MLTGVLTACTGAADQGAGTVTVGRPSGAPGQSSGAPSTAVPDAGTPDSEAPGGSAPTVAPGTGSVPASAGFATVDASRYQIDGSYYFQSPTGNIMCGVLATAPYGVGCQLRKANIITPKLPNCTDAPNRKVAAHLYEGKSEFLCTSQGIFVGIPQDGSAAGGAVLNYGESLTVNGYTCDSSSQGVRCRAGGHGFAISADDQHIF
ncbi:DUF6636 domain-containing protein [Nocardia sp. NPDC127606]|uniref:DUF6636 domain-containing protein n=1 Tax=Nocardia sp. NPDC127606 TaxID=3345406 RepID=UPI003627D265